MSQQPGRLQERPGRHGYPRPQLQRGGWTSLNGTWEFAIDPEGIWAHPNDVNWANRIEVPFSPETPASGIGDTSFYRVAWYRRTIDIEPVPAGHRVILHFGAVDYAAKVWINGCEAATHEGGYTPFSVDLSPFVSKKRVVIAVRAFDDPADLSQPRGKQDWQLAPHSIWYPRTTGVWQTVWLETVPSTWIERIRWTPNVERWEIGLEAWLGGNRREGLKLGVKLRVGNTLLADDTYAVVAGEVHRRIALSDPGIDDYRNGLLWNPSTPTLIDVQLRLWADRGDLLDEASSYTALRSVKVEHDRIVLNGRPYMLRLALDQGYWPETGLTPPDDDALRLDVELAKLMGFNGVRKHQKIEDPRYLYWADRLGLLVWEEMPSAYRFTHQSIQRVSREWIAAIERDTSHPCIIAWVPINESWGVPNLPTNPAERHYVQGLYHLTKTLDPTRPVIGNDGWESVATDIIGIHDYDSDPERIARRYRADEVLPRLFKRERPGGRLLVLEGDSPHEQPVIITEFGGIAFSKEPDTWGYSRAESARAFEKKYTELLRVVNSLGLLAGFCYTQFADTYQEANGLLYADRTPKFPLERMALATTGGTIVDDPEANIGSHPHPPLTPDDPVTVPVTSDDEPH
jgi:beta-galactosidase/beta-glucuronidase